MILKEDYAKTVVNVKRLLSVGILVKGTEVMKGFVVTEINLEE